MGFHYPSLFKNNLSMKKLSLLRKKSRKD